MIWEVVSGRDVPAERLYGRSWGLVEQLSTINQLFSINTGKRCIFSLGLSCETLTLRNQILFKRLEFGW
jgi:hypothetical protein